MIFLSALIDQDFSIAHERRFHHLAASCLSAPTPAQRPGIHAQRNPGEGIERFSVGENVPLVTSPLLAA